jgi:hypothetical protein
MKFSTLSLAFALASSVEPASSSFFSEKLTSFLRHMPQMTPLSPSRKLALDPNLPYHYSQLGDDIDGDKTAEFSGTDVAMSASGNRVAVGAEGYYGYKGSTVVFDYDPATGAWGQVGTVIVGPSGSYSGNNIELSNDGSRVAIGAKSDRGDRGSVFIYEFDGTNWNMLGSAIQGTIQQGEAGSGLALSGDGSTVAVGSPSANSSNGYVSVHRYNAETKTWDTLGTPFESQTKSRIGGAVALSLDGNRVVMGGRIHDVGQFDYAGVVRVYDLVDGDWQLSGELSGLDYYDRFGDDVDISDDGTRIMVGAFTSDGQFSTNDKRDIGQVTVWEQSGSGWIEIGNIVGEKQSDQLGSSVKMSGDGNVIIMGVPGSDDNGPNAGGIKVQIWNPDNNEFQPVGVDVGGECGSDKFGESVAINVDGSRIIAGSRLNSYYEGHSRVFQVMEGEGDGTNGVDNLCPTAKPSASPSNRPSASPTITVAPSVSPSSKPTPILSESPSSKPSVSPSSKPTSIPSMSPSLTASMSPSSTPTAGPTMSPSKSNSPTSSPTESSSSLKNISTVCMMLIGGFSVWFAL